MGRDIVVIFLQYLGRNHKRIFTDTRLAQIVEKVSIVKKLKNCDFSKSERVSERQLPKNHYGKCALKSGMILENIFT